MFLLWQARPSFQGLLVPGKRQWGTWEGQQTSLTTTSPTTDLHTDTIITVAALKSIATLIKGKLGGVPVELMLDSGSSVSLIQVDTLEGAADVVEVAAARQYN